MRKNGSARPRMQGSATPCSPTRHHDGYALWPTKYGDFNTRTKLAGRDLVGEYVRACRKVGMKVGLYYSPPDWYFNRYYMSFAYGSKGTPESPHLGLKHELVRLPDEPAGFNDQYVAYVNGQITELMTRYGKIDLLWFDGGAGPKMLSLKKIARCSPTSSSTIAATARAITRPVSSAGCPPSGPRAVGSTAAA